MGPRHCRWLARHLGRALKEERHRHLQDVGNLLQAARTNAVRPLLILLHLLERDPHCIAELRLAHAEHHSAHPHAIGHVFIDYVERLFYHRMNQPVWPRTRQSMPRPFSRAIDIEAAYA
jgi:hypothetical protein